MASGAASPPSHVPRLAGALALCGAGAASQVLYARGWDNALVSDDWFFVYRASKIESAAQLLQFFSFDAEAFVRPTQWLVTTALYRLFGTAPAGYHVTSQALDLGNALLVGLLAWQLQALVAGGQRPPSLLSAGLVGVLFLFSWRHHEGVFWFSAVNELPAGALRVLTLNGLAWSMRTGRGGGALWLALLAGSGLAMLSKESAVTCPPGGRTRPGRARGAGGAWRSGVRPRYSTPLLDALTTRPVCGGAILLHHHKAQRPPGVRGTSAPLRLPSFEARMPGGSAASGTPLGSPGGRSASLTALSRFH